jgi:hypothetical protein
VKSWTDALLEPEFYLDNLRKCWQKPAIGLCVFVEGKKSRTVPLLEKPAR